uniref:Uncharacterized protein n=1 Tax=Rhizophora mucronata TaxID=61149 RepID=A0A2P2JL32_RHIMU
MTRPQRSIPLFLIISLASKTLYQRFIYTFCSFVYFLGNETKPNHRQNERTYSMVSYT